MGVSLEFQPEDERVECSMAYSQAGRAGRADVPTDAASAKALACNASAQCWHAAGSDTADPWTQQHPDNAALCSDSATERRAVLSARIPVT